MSELNGDRARFQKNRQRKLRNRQRSWALTTALRGEAQQRVALASAAPDAASPASAAMHDEGGPTLAGD